MHNGLSETESRLYAYIERFMRLRGYPPSITEMQENADINSRSGVQRYLNRLESAGYIKRFGEYPRQAMSLPKGNERYQGEISLLPLIDSKGNVTDRLPVLPAPGDRCLMTVDKECLAGKVVYRGAEICEGDLVLIERGQWSKIGAVAVMTPYGDIKLLSEGSVKGEPYGLVIGFFRQ